jgi:hypothetical protein
MSMVNIDAWYVVQTQVNAEEKAARNLMRQGFEVYLPRHLWRRRGRKILLRFASSFLKAILPELHDQVSRFGVLLVFAVHGKGA